MDRVALGKALREAREAQKLTLRQVGEAAGLSHAYIAAAERAEPNANLTLKAVESIAAALGLDVEIVVGVDVADDIRRQMDGTPERRQLLLSALRSLARLPMSELDLEADMLARRADRAAGDRTTATG